MFKRVTGTISRCFYSKSGHLPAEFVETKSDISDSTLQHFLSRICGNKPGAFDSKSGHLSVKFVTITAEVSSRCRDIFKPTESDN